MSLSDTSETGHIVLDILRFVVFLFVMKHEF